MSLSISDAYLPKLPMQITSQTLSDLIAECLILILHVYVEVGRMNQLIVTAWVAIFDFQNLEL